MLEDQLCYSGKDQLCIKTGDFPVHRERLQERERESERLQERERRRVRGTAKFNENSQSAPPLPPAPFPP